MKKRVKNNNLILRSYIVTPLQDDFLNNEAKKRDVSKSVVLRQILQKSINDYTLKPQQS